MTGSECDCVQRCCCSTRRIDDQFSIVFTQASNSESDASSLWHSDVAMWCEQQGLY